MAWRFSSLMILAAAAAACVSVPVPPSVSQAPSLERGQVIYRRACATCHGVEGDGQGASAHALDVEPRDFTRGVFRYRSTPTGSLPTDEDLLRTVRDGLPGTPMPAWRDVLSEQATRDVVAWVKHFSPRFGKEEIEAPVPIPDPIAWSPESVERGRLAYVKLQCGKCHGERGRGDGWAKSDEMKDDLGRVVRARDFTQGIYRSGRSKQDLWRVFTTGLDGSPMPAHEGSASAEELYDIVNYLLSLEQDRGLWFWLATPPRWYEPSEQRVPR